MLCQDVMCYAGLPLYNGECDVYNQNLEENACFSIFIKLTPTQNVALLTNFLLCDEETFTRSLRKCFDEELGITNNSTGFLYFRKLDHFSHIDYLVIYAVFGFSSHSEKVYKVKRLIEKKYFTFIPLQVESLSFDLKLELSVYNLNFSDFNFPDVAAELHVTTDFRTSFDTLTETFDSSSVRSAMCSANEKIALTRLHLCPFVKIPVRALSMKITNGFLCVYEDSDSSKIVKVLPKWDYDINDNNILMCLDDYLDLYNAIPAQTSDEAGVESFYTLICFYVTVVVYLF